MKNVIKVEIIKEFIKNNNLTVKKFCEMTKMNKSTYYKIMHNDLNFDINYLFRIAKILKIQVFELFNE